MRLEHEHTAEAIRARLAEERRPNYLRDWIYGGIDGAVTTFAVVSGVVGAGLQPYVVLILGVANLIADGFSMAASNYSGTKAENDEIARLIEVEHRHIRFDPEGEREEIRQIMNMKGMSGPALEEAVEVLTANHDLWVSTMLVEEYGVSPRQRSPMTAGLSTFAAFVVCGGLPLLPFIFGWPSAFVTASVLVGCTFVGIGAAKSLWSTAPWWRSGLETLAIGSIAAALAYGIGYLLKGVAGAAGVG